MTDARYPEAWLNDRRVVRLSDAAHRLFVTTLAWSASNRTDGVLEAADLALVNGVRPEHAPELVEAGLWNVTRAGWTITIYESTQTSAAQLAGLEKGRIAERQKKARQRAHKAGDHALCRPDTCADSRDPREVSRNLPESWSRTPTPQVLGVGVPGDSPGDVLGEAKDRTGQDRQGALDGTQSELDRPTMCSVCGLEMNHDLIWCGETTHPSCAA